MFWTEPPLGHTLLQVPAQGPVPSASARVWPGASHPPPRAAGAGSLQRSGEMAQPVQWKDQTNTTKGKWLPVFGSLWQGGSSPQPSKAGAGWPLTPAPCMGAHVWEAPVDMLSWGWEAQQLPPALPAPAASSPSAGLGSDGPTTALWRGQRWVCSGMWQCSSGLAQLGTAALAEPCSRAKDPLATTRRAGFPSSVVTRIWPGVATRGAADRGDLSGQRGGKRGSTWVLQSISVSSLCETSGTWLAYPSLLAALNKLQQIMLLAGLCQRHQPQA